MQIPKPGAHNSHSVESGGGWPKNYISNKRSYYGMGDSRPHFEKHQPKGFLDVSQPAIGSNEESDPSSWFSGIEEVL